MFSASWKSRADVAEGGRLGLRGAALRGVVLSPALGARFRVYLLAFLLSCNNNIHLTHELHTLMVTKPRYLKTHQ